MLLSANGDKVQNCPNQQENLLINLHNVLVSCVFIVKI